MSRTGGSSGVRELVENRLKVDPESGSVAEGGAGDGGSSRRRRWRALPVLPLLAVGLLVATLVVGYLNLDHDRGLAAGDDAAEVVEPRVEKLLSYTPSTVASDLEAEGDWLTGDFARDYADLVTGTIAPAATTGEVTTQASVTGVGVDSASSDRVVLLMFVNVSTTSAAAPEAQVTGSRLRVTAVQDDGEWRISEIRPV